MQMTFPAALREILKWCTVTYPRKFDETIELHLTVSLDPRKPGQSIRTSVPLPHPFGKKKKICVFMGKEKTDEAEELLKNAGAHVVGDEQLVADIADTGKVNFDSVTALSSTVPEMSKTLAKLLGPKGLMPGKKVPHSVADDLTGLLDNVRRLAKSPLLLKTESKFGQVHTTIGRVSLGEKKLLDNMRDLMIALQAAKPEKAPKGRLIKSASIASTMGPGIYLDVATIEPGSPRFLRDILAANAKRVVLPPYPYSRAPPTEEGKNEDEEETTIKKAEETPTSPSEEEEEETQRAASSE